MQHFVSTQTFSIRHYAGSHPHRAPGERIGFAYAPNLAVAGPELTAGTGLILDRLASSLHHSYDRGGGSQVGACRPPAATGASRSGSTRCSTSRGGCSRPGTESRRMLVRDRRSSRKIARLPPAARRSRRAAVQSKKITLRIRPAPPSGSKPRFTSSSVSRWSTSASTSISPASQRSISTGTWSRPFTPPNDEPATRRPAGDQEPRDDVERLALAGHARDRAEAPAHARGLDGLPHDPHVAGRLEGVVGAEAAGGLDDPLHHVLAAGQRLGRADSALVEETAPRRGRRRRSAPRPPGGSRSPRRARPGPPRTRRTSTRARPSPC